MNFKKSIFMTLATVALTATAANPLLNYEKWQTPHGTYPFNEIKKEHYMPAFEEGMRQGLAEIDAIVNNPASPTFANTIEAYEKAGRTLDVVSSCFFNLTSAETDDELAALQVKITPKLTEYGNKISLNEALFKRIKTVYEQRNSLKLNAEQRKLLEEVYDSFVRNGANLSDAEKKTYSDLSVKLSEYTTTFGQNVLKATNAWTMLITKEEDLKGLNDDTKQMLANNAKAKGYDSGWLLDLKPTTYGPVLEDCDNRDIRRELYTAYNTRCLGGEFDNTQVIINIVNTRLKIAQLFGNDCYADKVLEHRMAKNKSNVYNLLDQLRDSYLPVAQKEVEEIQEYANKQGFYGKIQPWDWSYYSKKLKQEKYAISDDLTKPYFELNNVIQGAFGLAKRLYGITFKQNKQIQVYNPEVTAYEVFDAQGNFLAVYYADFHPRDGKRGGAWMNEYKAQWREGKYDSRPHITNVMNFTRATDDKPALLKYSEVETFLHEFGHALHGMLTKCQYASLSGTSVYRDFVELPSQFHENFLGEKEFLDTFAKHYLTGEKIPQELIDKIKQSETYHAGYACVRQLSFGYLDMAWHGQSAEFVVPPTLTTEEAVVKFGNAAMASVQVLPIVLGTQMETSFNHIFSGGYAAGYYGYKWAEVLDADAYSFFQAAKAKTGTIFDKKAANAFKTNILEKGGTEDPAVLYRKFRGADPTINALLKRDGIKK